MAKVAIVGPKTQLGPAVAAVHELGVLHIEDYVPGEAGFELGSPLPDSPKVSERLLRVRGVLKGAQMTPPGEVRAFTAENLGGLQQKLGEVEAELSHLVDQRHGHVDELKRLDEEEAVLRRFQNFPLPLELLHGYRSLALVVGFLPPGADPAPLSAVHRDAEVEASDEADGRFVVAFAPRAAEKALQEAASKLRLEPIEAPRVEGTAAQRRGRAAQERARVQAQLAEVEQAIAAIRDRYAGAFYALDEYLGLLADRSVAPVRFRTTRNSFMVEGWVPREELARLRAALQSATRNEVFVAELPTPATTPWKRAGTAGHAATQAPAAEAAPAEAEVPPVHLRNPRAASSYELLTDTYARPKYTEIDPTLFFFIGFPLFYGLMLGDVGYGALLLALVGFGVFERLFRFFGFESTHALNRIFLHCGLVSVLFGFLYGEFFGVEFIGPAERHHEPTGVWIPFETHWGPLTLPLSRFHEVKLLLGLTIAIGAFHMLLGLALGLRNAVHEHGWVEAIKHRGSWFLILLAATAAGLVLVPTILGLGRFPLPEAPVYLAALAAFTVGVLLLLVGEGATALMEIPTVLSNLLSYTRLLAIGLSGAGIALAGNKVAGLAFDAGGAGLAAGLLILALFHLINLALGIVGPALHSLRLHYVEFFTKFYAGGGVPYAPFRTNRRFTTKEVKHG